MSYSILFSREILTNYSTHASSLPPQQNSTLHIHVLVGKHPNKVSVKIWHLKKSLVFGKWCLESFFVFSIYFLEENVVGFLVFLLLPRWSFAVIYIQIQRATELLPIVLKNGIFSILFCQHVSFIAHLWSQKLYSWISIQMSFCSKRIFSRETRPEDWNNS